LVIILPGVIGYYYFQDSLFEAQDTVYPELVKRVLPKWMVGFFAAVIMGAVLSTFNSVLNSAATIFSKGIYQRHIHRRASEKRLVFIGKTTSALLAIVAIMTAPLVADAPDGLYQLLQQLNGIFFIPVASILLAGFFIKRISAMGAKASLFVGLAFYITMAFILKSDIHFVHLWGIEFLLNMVVMFAVSYFYPNDREFEPEDKGVVELEPWKYTQQMGILLVVVTILIYIWLT